MTTTHADDKTPGTLKAALIVWMIAMGALLGYSIATADATADEEDGHAPAESSETGHGTPAASPDGGHESPEASTPASPTDGDESPAGTASPATSH